MTPFALRSLEHVHGHLAWLSVAALLHPALLLSRPNRRAPLAASLATGLVLVTASLGALVYSPYRDRIKQHIFLDAPRIGWLFERKEHLAVGAVAFALVGLVAHLSAPRLGPELRAPVVRTAHRAYLLAFAFALVVAVLGVVVASYRSL